MFVAFHPALRINSNPLDPNASVVMTVNLALDHPDNFQLSPKWETTKVVHHKITDLQITEQASTASPRKRDIQGLGNRMKWDVEITAYPLAMNGFVLVNAGDAELQQLQDELAQGASGFNDATSRYLWFSPNYQWGSPAEQWIRVNPEGPVTLAPAGTKTLTHTLRASLVTAYNYKNITWQYQRRGGIVAFAGSFDSSTLSPIVTGSFTQFLAKLIPGDLLWLGDGGTGLITLIGTVQSVQSNTQLTLTANALATISGGSGTAEQKSHPAWLVPIYTLTPFAPIGGWGVSPWGDNWGN